MTDPGGQSQAIAIAKAGTEKHLGVLNDHMLGDGRVFLCGEAITLADYLASGIVSLGEVIGCRFAPWPNIVRWYGRMKARPNWQATNGA